MKKCMIFVIILAFWEGFSPHITAAYLVCHATQNIGVMILSLELLPQLQEPPSPIPPPLSI